MLRNFCSPIGARRLCKFSKARKRSIIGASFTLNLISLIACIVSCSGPEAHKNCDFRTLRTEKERERAGVGDTSETIQCKKRMKIHFQQMLSMAHKRNGMLLLSSADGALHDPCALFLLWISTSSQIFFLCSALDKLETLDAAAHGYHGKKLCHFSPTSLSWGSVQFLSWFQISFFSSARSFFHRMFLKFFKSTFGESLRVQKGRSMAWLAATACVCVWDGNDRNARFSSVRI